MATQRAPKHDTGRADRVVNKVIELFRREAVQLGHLPPFFDGSAGCLIVSGCRCPSVRGDARETVELLDGRNRPRDRTRSEEHTSELQSLMRNSYAVLSLKKKQL